jgi:hypothetical protein
MPRGELSVDEKAAGTIVARQVGGKRIIPRDIPGAPDGMHDLDIELPDGRMIAVEVTFARQPKLVSIYATAFGKRWEAPSLSAHWQVAFESGKPLDVPRLAAGIVPHLELLETLGVTEAGTVTSDAWRRAGDDVASAIQQIAELGATHVRRWNEPTPGETPLLLFSGHQGVGGSPGAVNALVEERAGAKVKKLVASGADERHLFVWIDSSHSEAELGMATMPPPATTPSVPAGIDVVWAATSGITDKLFERLWRLELPEGQWDRLSDVEGPLGLAGGRA